MTKTKHESVLMIKTLVVDSMFCCARLCAHSSFAIILMGMRELVARCESMINTTHKNTNDPQKKYRLGTSNECKAPMFEVIIHKKASIQTVIR